MLLLNGTIPYIINIENKLTFSIDILFSGAWSAKQSDDSQWLQVDLGERSVVTAVVTQGRADLGQWVTSYKVVTARC